MKVIIMLLVSVGLSIVKANGWFVVPDPCLYIAYGATAVLVIAGVVNAIRVRREYNRVRRQVNSRLSHFL